MKMGQDVECAHLCDVSLDKAAAKQIHDLIQDEYLVEWYVCLASVLTF
jgi:Endomembrane protein 70